MAVVAPPARGTSLEDFLALCRANPELRLERTAEGEVRIVPPTGGEGGYRSGDALAQLAVWARRAARGKCFDSNTEFVLPDGSALCPDAAWVSNDALNRLTLEERQDFLRLSPEFVIEVMSKTDRLAKARQKMDNWISNGVQLAWLIDGDNRTVYVYRQGRAPVTRKNLKEIAGEGPVNGFVLQLESIWRGLR